MDRETGERRDDATTTPADEGHGFAETLPADGAGWERALATDDRAVDQSKAAPEAPGDREDRHHHSRQMPM